MNGVSSCNSLTAQNIYVDVYFETDVDQQQQRISALSLCLCVVHARSLTGWLVGSHRFTVYVCL